MSTGSALMMHDETTLPAAAPAERYDYPLNARGVTALPAVLPAAPREGRPEGLLEDLRTDTSEGQPGDLPRPLPPLFASALAGFLRPDAVPPLTLFVAADEVLGERTPDRALALTADGVVFLEAGEVVLGKTPWGVKSLLYPYTKITAVGLGTALLTARFTLHGMGNAPICEIPLQTGDIPRFETAARLISERIAADGNC